MQSLPRATQTSFAWVRTISSLYATTSLSLRAGLAVLVSLLLGAKVLTLAAVVALADSHSRAAIPVGGAAMLTLALIRIASNRVRVQTECDLQYALARSLIEGDVLVVSSHHTPRALVEPAFHARALVSTIVPELVASALALFAVVPLLAMRLSLRALAVGAVATSSVFVALWLLRRVTSTAQSLVADAQLAVGEHVASAMDGRLELVSRGGDATALRAIACAIHAYRRVAYRGSWSAALLGRAPLVVGIAVVLLVFFFDASNREAVRAEVLGQALVLAASAPVLLGVVMRTSDVLRVSAMVRPVLDVLAVRLRPEFAREGSAPPPMPATIEARQLAFAYADDHAPTFRDVSFNWTPGTRLIVEGPNGSGKSTLLRLLLGLRLPKHGTLTVAAIPFEQLDLRSFRQKIAYLPQRPYLGESYVTVRDAMLIAAAGAEDSALMTALTRVGLSQPFSRTSNDRRENENEVLEVSVGELSAGQRQRLALARVLLQDAAVYLLDEPDANLDRAGIELVVDVISELLARGRMVALAAHTRELSSLEGTRVRLG